KPIASIDSITADGGAAPPVATSTRWSKRTFASSGAWISMLSTIGAPHMCVTRCSRIAAKIRAGSTRRRHTCVPPAAVTDQAFVAGAFGIVDVDDQQCSLRRAERSPNRWGIFRIRDEDACFAVVETERDHPRIEPRIERVEDSAQCGYGVMRFQ